MDKKQKTTLNPINKKDNKSFQQALTVALTHEEIKKDANWDGIYHPSEKNYWKKFEKNNVKKKIIFCMLKMRK